MEEAEQVAHFGGWEVNLTTGEVKWSLKMYQILGYDPLTTKATFGNFIRIVHKDDVYYIKSNLEALLKSPSDEVYYFRIFNQQDHKIKYLRTGIVANRDSKGIAVSLTGFSHDITENVLAKKNLENINKELNTFFNVIDDVFFSIDVLTFRIIQVSQAFEKVFGYTRQEILADLSLFEQLYSPDDEVAIVDAYNKLQRGETAIVQFRVLNKSQSTLWVECKVIPGLDQFGKLTRVDGVICDIAGRKNAELQLQRSEYRFRQLIESAQEGIWTLDENNVTNFVNKKICEILEYSPEEMMGKDLLHFVDINDHAEIEECIERRKRGAKENLHIRYVTKSGKYVWTSINANPIFDENGVYKGALAMVTDITEQRQSQQLLKESEANLRSIFENTDVGFVLYNQDFNIVSFNSIADTYCRLHFQRSLQTGINGITYSPENKKELINSILLKIRSGETVDHELNYHLQNNEIKWYHIRWVGVINDEQVHIGVLLTLKDITARKLMELESQKITADLIARNKDQEQFNYMVSHNLRAPVANISGLVQLLNDPELNDEDKNHVLECLSQSVKSLDTVIVDMHEVLHLKKF